MTPRSLCAPSLVLPDGARLWRWRELLGAPSREVLSTLMEEIPWSQPEVRVFGKRHPVPRLQCWMGEPEARYRYSGLLMDPLPWHPLVTVIRARVESLTGLRFNSALVNLYRDGRDRMGWHRDDEPELGASPWVASFSLGAVRDFTLRPRGATRTAEVLALEHDELLLMGPEVQWGWEHGLPTRRGVTAPRINLTFRRVTGSTRPM